MSRGELSATRLSESVGEDVFGSYDELVLTLTPVNHTGPHYVDVSFREYAGNQLMMLTQTFRGGDFDGASTGDANGVSSGFPSVTADPEAELGFLAYGGIMTGDTNKRIGRWSKSSHQIASGLDSGPLVLFDYTPSTLIIAPFNHFMVMSASYSTDEKTNATYGAWGPLGSVATIPRDSQLTTLMYFSPRGINNALTEWGALLRRWYGKEPHYREADLTNNYLGYWTDNGAYYYYLTEQNKTYEQTILDVKAYADQQNIPYRYVQYDSWWYPKGPDGGVTEWTAMPAVFPSGLGQLWNRTGWPVSAHNRWWSSKTSYAKSNGGKYNFVVEPLTHKAIPHDQAFWDDLMSQAKMWGLTTYEQDWLNDEFDMMNITKTDFNMGRDWLLQMGKGAQRSGLTIQYCMAPSRHILQSLEIPAVTQTRVSGDYQPGNDQWKIGVSSIFAHALGLAPFKDNYWSTSNQTGDKYHRTEPFPALQSVVATLSTGPVGPSDRIGLSDVALIMKSVNADGLILKPDRPATAVDDQIAMAAFRDFSGEVWTTHTTVSGLFFGIVLAADFSDDDMLALTPHSAGFERTAPLLESVVFSHSDQDAEFSSQKPLILRGCSKAQFCLYYVSPVLTVGDKDLVIYGEMSKWVPVSGRRVRSLELRRDSGEATNLLVTIVGGNGENVDFFMRWGTEMLEFKCVIPPEGVTTINVLERKCGAV